MTESAGTQPLVSASHLAQASSQISIPSTTTPNTSQSISKSTPQSNNGTTASGSVTTSSSKKRVRTGCMNCRRKHKKCDEVKPICSTCQQKNENCEWPTPKLKKSNSRRSSLSIPSNGYGGYTTSAAVNPGVSAVNSYLQQGANVNSMNYPLQSRPVSNEASINPSFKRPRIETSSPLEQLSQLVPASTAAQINHQLPQQMNHQEQSFISNRPNSSQQPPNALHPVSPFGTLAFDDQAPRRASTDLSSYSLVNAANAPLMSQNQHQLHFTPGPQIRSQNNFTPPLQQQQIQEYQQAHSLSYQSPAPSSSNGNLTDPKLNLNKLLNSQGPINPQQLQQPQSSIRHERFSALDETLKTKIDHSRVVDGETNPMTSTVHNGTVPFDQLAFKTLKKRLDSFLTYNMVTKETFPYVELSSSEQAMLINRFIVHVSPKLNVLGSDFWSSFVPVLSKSSDLVKCAIYTIALFDMKCFEKGLQVFLMSFNYMPEERGKLPVYVSLTILTLATTLVSSHTDWKVTVKNLSTFLNTNSAKDNTWISKSYNNDCLWWCVLKEIDTLEIGEEGSAFSKETLESYTQGSEITQIISLLSQTVNLIGSNDIQDFDEKWRNLWEKTQAWFLNRNTTSPLIEFKTNSSGDFPVLVYGSGPAALSNQLYHTASIILLQNKPRTLRFQSSVRPVTYHAKHIVGSTLNNEYLESWNNINQCLWNAGKIFTHQDEHKTILNLIATIQEKTGQVPRYNVGSFQQYWRETS
ncbi:hypothetical protein BN7_3819 [Wickerhamomyces ciferrii]|uniref:Zn(2)-C6 fungal-type domain-containing protein n=1 Tax=Wickerhamomyces ciferrii (strain ATCC 14091 / BCRC 22168 / CBS 111 / JCM 3599 / NBRC 0793 / NRRL Y-1031 F-60-10) TaxID=1206466 RepID=K0KSG7_WICCF|nr:uncharacterized protein BN7_3819 [Wickerhamomyces ciferrii]CCH44258.1 hypothetical protein BN7_3819 [Wickerhamomyces ciferrii]